MRVSPPTHPDIGISSVRKSELPGLSEPEIRPRRAFYRRFFGDKGVRKFADGADRRVRRTRVAPPASPEIGKSVSSIPAARFLASPSRVSQGVPG